MIMWAPSRAAACAVAKPMPELPPNTTTRFPFSGFPLRVMARLRRCDERIDPPDPLLIPAHICRY
jgi:hypothetical protein